MLGRIVSATPAHALRMAPNVRAMEVREVLEGVGLEPEAVLLRELSRSISAWSWIVNDEVACMFGVIKESLLDAPSYPWFLTTPLVEQHARQFARACKTLLPELLERHPQMTGLVDARYALSIRWLKWLGASVGPAQPLGAAGALFCKYELGR
jgi:hypothetical protein